MKNFYAVKAKCGHVGKKYYYEGTFYITAESKKEAAAITRLCPRVKHNHKDAILSVESISPEEYTIGTDRYKNEIYFMCENIQEQKMFWTEIQQKVFIEPKYLIEEKEITPKQKKPYKRERFYWKKEIFDIALS